MWCVVASCAHLIACWAYHMRGIASMFPCHLWEWFVHVDSKMQSLRWGLQKEDSEVGEVSGEEEYEWEMLNLVIMMSSSWADIVEFERNR